MKTNKILIGWGARDVTPEKPVSLRGQFRVRISEKVLDPLTVTALALESEDKSEQAVMVSIDSANVQDLIDKCRKDLAVKIPDFKVEKLFINAIHSHAAPYHGDSSLHPNPIQGIMSMEEYTVILVNGIIEAVVEAWTSRKAGALSWGNGQAVVGYNRRMTYFDGVSAMYGNTDDENFSHIEGYEDHGVAMLFTYDEKQELTGMIVNLACPSQISENINFVSADFWHETRVEIKKRHGKNIFILPQCSAAGDQSPHLLLKKKAEIRMLELKGFSVDIENQSAFQTQMAHRQEIANRISNAVDEVLPLASKDIRKKLVFKHRTMLVELPARLVTETDCESASKQVELAKEKLADIELEPTARVYSENYAKINYFGAVLTRFEKQKTEKTLSTEFHIIRLGDIAFATNRFELFLDYGIRIQARSKAIQTFVVQLTENGTYLPTQKAVDAKSYGAGAESNLVGPEGGQVLVDTQVEAINKMFIGEE